MRYEIIREGPQRPMTDPFRREAFDAAVHAVSEGSGAAWLREQSRETVVAAKQLAGLDGFCAGSGAQHLVCRPAIASASVADLLEEGAILTEQGALTIGALLATWGAGELLAAAGAWAATASATKGAVAAGSGAIALLASACGMEIDLPDEPPSESTPDDPIAPDDDRQRPTFAPHEDGDVDDEVESNPALCGNGTLDPGEECEVNDWGEWIGCTDCLLDPGLTLILSRDGASDAVRREEARAVFRIVDAEAPTVLCSLPERDVSGTYSTLYRFDSSLSQHSRLLTGFYDNPWRLAAVDTDAEWLFYQMQGWQGTRPRLVHIEEGIVIPLEGEGDVTLEGMEAICASRDLAHLGGIALIDGDDSAPARAFRRASLLDLMEHSDPPSPAAQRVEVQELLQEELTAGARTTAQCMDDRGNAAIAGWSDERSAIGAIHLIDSDNAVTHIAPEIVASAQPSAPVIAPEGTLCFLAKTNDDNELICTSADDPDAIERSPAPETAEEIIGISEDGLQVIASDKTRTLSIFDRETNRWIEPDLGGITQGDIIVAAAVAGRWLFVRSEYNDGGDIATAVWRIALTP